MEELTLDNIPFVFLFAIPGFITLKVYGLLTANGNRDISQQLFDAVAYSCINYAVMALPYIWISESTMPSNHPTLYHIIQALLFILIPIGLAFGYWCFRKSEFALNFFPHPNGKAWDYFFSQGYPTWIVVTLKNGRKVGGWFGEKSFASGDPNAPELYIEEAYHINDDGGFDAPFNQTQGILITESEISTINFYKPVWGKDNEH